MAIVSNTSPLLYWHASGKDDLLRNLVDVIKIPQAVLREIQRSISLVSTISLLLDAKKARMIELVEPHLNELKTVGFWISDNLFDRVLRMAGEHPQS